MNTKVRYGLRALIEVALEGDAGLHQKDIAERQSIPLKYLDPIIAGLKMKGLIRNIKGKGSGYILAKPASEISVYDVYCAFEPEMAIVECVNNVLLCDMANGCVVSGFWTELNGKIVRELANKKISEFL